MSMTKDLRQYKTKLNRRLEPIKVMLVNRRTILPTDEWLHFVQKTKASIMVHPDQYLGEELPPPELLTRVIEIIFADFLKDQLSYR